MGRAPSRGGGGTLNSIGTQVLTASPLPAGPAAGRTSPHGGEARLVLFGRVRKQCDRPGALESGREGALVPRARAGDTPGKDLAAVADESPQAGDLLVVDVADLLDAEAAHLAVLALRSSASAAAAARFAMWSVDCHQ